MHFLSEGFEFRCRELLQPLQVGELRLRGDIGVVKPVTPIRLAMNAQWSPDGISVGTIGNLIWLVLAGWWLAVAHLIIALGLAITIIGLPFAWAHLKLAGLALWPIGQNDNPDRRPPASPVTSYCF